MDNSQIQARIDADLLVSTTLISGMPFMPAQRPPTRKCIAASGVSPRNNSPASTSPGRAFWMSAAGTATGAFTPSGAVPRSVLATDDFSQNWSSADGLFLARELLGSTVQTADAHFRLRASADSTGRSTLFCSSGSITTSSIPSYAFAQLRHCCHPGHDSCCLEGNAATGLPENAAIFDPAVAGSKILPTSRVSTPTPPGGLSLSFE